ncbi:MAG: flagellar hook-basal body complex protein FliE [Rhodospirillaceae bacterium]|nr:flagellar hook-basal body complex protein FliE [Rhodospirillaceae bacterium]
MSDFSINSISNSVTGLNSQAGQALDTSKNNNGPDFLETVTGALDSVAQSQSEAGDIKLAFEMGKETDLAQVMVKSQVSGLAFDMALNVRNKVLSAYKDIMSMPV